MSDIELPTHWSAQQRTDYLEAERLMAESIAIGKRASDLMSGVMGGYTVARQEWFQRRLSFLDPERYLRDHEFIVISEALQALPLGGQVLDLCCGDGWYDRWFLSPRAGDVIAIDHDPFAIATAQKWHSASNINYYVEDVLKSDYLLADSFDLVFMRGAIEHFTTDEQSSIFTNVTRVLKPGGAFVGDTTSGSGGDAVHHRHEWETTFQLADQLRECEFLYPDVFEYQTRERLTFIWVAHVPISV